MTESTRLFETVGRLTRACKLLLLIAEVVRKKRVHDISWRINGWTHVRTSPANSSCRSSLATFHLQNAYVSLPLPEPTLSSTSHRHRRRCWKLVNRGHLGTRGIEDRSTAWVRRPLGHTDTPDTELTVLPSHKQKTPYWRSVILLSGCCLLSISIAGKFNVVVFRFILQKNPLMTDVI